jgi:hypothetical protein
MNRRELLAAVGSLATGVGVKAEAEVIDAEPKPLLAVLRPDFKVTPEILRAMREQWQRLLEGREQIPLVVLQPGMELQILRDPRGH